MVTIPRQARRRLLAVVPTLTILVVLVAISLASGWVHLGSPDASPTSAAKARPLVAPKLHPRYPQDLRATTLRLVPLIGHSGVTSGMSDRITAKIGDYLRLYVMIENPTSGETKAPVQATRLTVTVPRVASVNHTISIHAVADNAPPVTATATINLTDGAASILSSPYSLQLFRNHPSSDNYYKFGPGYELPGASQYQYNYGRRATSITFMPGPNGNLSNAYGKEIEFSFLLKVGGADLTGHPRLGVRLQVRRYGDELWRDSTAATVGDLLEYRVEARNSGDGRANDAYLTAYTNNGVMFVPGSGRQDQQGKLVKMDDSLSGSGLYIGDLVPGDSRIYRYNAKVLDSRSRSKLQGSSVQLSADRAVASFDQTRLRVFAPAP